jgi:outer membrane protein assembly factor BamB
MQLRIGKSTFMSHTKKVSTSVDRHPWIRPALVAFALLGLVAGTSVAAEAPSWPCYQGPNSNFSATDCGLTLVDDLKDARLLWKSQEPTPPGAAQSPRYGGHAWHSISLRDFRPIKIPLAGGGEAISGGGIPLPGGGASSLLAADGRIFATYFTPSGDVIDIAEQKKRDLGPGTWTPDYWRVAADDVVLAVDAATGKTLWKQVLKDKGLNWTDHKSIITNHTGVVFGGRVYAIGSTCRTYCLDAATGRVIWEGDLGAEHKKLEEIKKNGLAEKKSFGGINRGHCNGSTFAAGVWVCPDFQGGLIGFDGETGMKLWQVPKCLAHHATPTRWVHDGGESILTSNVEGTVHCIDPKTGKDRWTIDAGRQEATLSVAGDMLFLNIGKESIGMGDEKLTGRASGWKITPKNATKIWEHTDAEKVGFIGGGMSGLPVWKDRLFIRTKSGTSMVDGATGKVLARSPEANVTQESHGYCAEGRFFHEPDSQHGSIHDVLMLGTTPEMFKPTGKPWNTPHYDATGYEMPISHPVVSGRLYIRGADGIYCWDLRPVRSK